MREIRLTCFQCKDSGFVVAMHKSKPGVFAFKCGCGSSIRRGLSDSIPVWSSRFSGEYIPDGHSSGEAVSRAPAPVIQAKPQAVPKTDFKAVVANQGKDDFEDEVPF